MSGIFPDSGVPANQALNSVNVPTANCGGDAGELFHSTSRCTPRFDPAAANAVMSEILNVMDDAGIPYDCNRLDNLSLAVQQAFDQRLTGCLDADVQFPDATGACSIEQLVLTRDAAGCRRIARFVSGSSQLATAAPGASM